MNFRNYVILVLKYLLNFLKYNVDFCFILELSHHTVASVSDCQELMDRGWRNRSTGATLMNADSSRSHSIFSISVEMMPLTECLEVSPIRRGKLSLVDLAGSERQAKTGILIILGFWDGNSSFMR